MTSEQASKRRCQEDCTALRLSVDNLQAKGEQFDALQSKLEETEKDNRALQQKDTMNAITLKSLVEAHEADRLRLHELDRKVELLTMDKMFLNKELDIVSERSKGADKERERLNSKVDDLRKHKDQLVEQLSPHATHSQTSTASTSCIHSRSLSLSLSSLTAVLRPTGRKCAMSTRQRMRRSWRSEAAAHVLHSRLSLVSMLTASAHTSSLSLYPPLYCHCPMFRPSCSGCMTGLRAS